jgi:hypothetical protein
VDFDHDGTNLNIKGVNTSAIKVWNGIPLHLESLDEGERLTLQHDGSHGVIGTAGTAAGNVRFTSDVEVRAGGNLVIWNAGNTDNADFSHDGTDFNTAFTLTSDWNITGLGGAVQFDTGQTLRWGAGAGTTQAHIQASDILLEASGTTEQVRVASSTAGVEFLVGTIADPDAVFLVTGASITHTGNTVWTSGNDGDTSGLDADTIAGIPNTNLMTFTGAQVPDFADLGDVTSVGLATDQIKRYNGSAWANFDFPLVSQAQAEAGTDVNIKGWSALRVKQAIDALAPGGGAHPDPHQLAFGTAGAPAYSFSSDTDTGMWGAAAQINFSVSATSRAEVTTTYLGMNITSGAQMMYETPSATNPVFTFNGDLNTGIGRNGADQLSIIAGGTEVVRASTTNCLVGNFNFDTTPAVGVGQDNCVLTYNHLLGEIALEAASGGSSTAADITVTDESADTTCFPAFFTAATGDLTIHTGTNLTFNSSTGNLSATQIAGIANAQLVAKNATETISGAWTFSNAGNLVSGNLEFQDSAELRFGTDNDSRIFNNGTQLELNTSSDIFYIRSTGSENMAIFSPDSTCAFYWNGVRTLVTQDNNGTDNITGALVKHWDGVEYDVGLARMPKVNFAVNLTVSDTHWHKRLVHTSGTTHTLTFNTEASQPNDVVMWVLADAGAVTLVDGTMVLNLFDGSGAPSTGNITVARGGWATIVKDGDSNAHVTGVGLS